MKYLTSLFFLSTSFWNRSLGFLFILALFSLWKTFFLTIIILSIVIFLFRRNPKRESNSLEKGIFYSPVNGTVNRIKYHIDTPIGENFIEIRILTHVWSGFGLYLPMTSEVSKVVFNESKKKALRYFFKSKQGIDYGLSFKKRLFGLYPVSPLLAGDRGSRQAVIGLFPLGGYTYFYIPEASKLLVKEGEKIMAGDSLIASIDKELN